MADAAGGPDLEIRFVPGGGTVAGDLSTLLPGSAGGALVVDGLEWAATTPLEGCGLAHGVTIGGGPPAPRPPVEVVVVAGPLPPAAWPLGPGPVLVGRGAAVDVRLDHASVGPAAVLLEPTVTGWTACSLDPATPARLDGTPLGGPRALGPGAVLSVGAVDLQLLRTVPAAAVRAPSQPLRRPPRIPEPSPEPPGPGPEPTPVPEPPTPPGLLSLALPVAVGAVLALSVHPTAGLFAAATPLLAVGAHLDARRRHRRSLRRANADHAGAVRDHTAAVADHERQRAARRRRRFPTAVEALDRARSSRDLWPVRPGDPDGDRVAVGWTDDGRRDPVTVALGPGDGLGITGPLAWAEAAARALVLQATIRCGPSDRRVEADARGPWGFTRWLPHQDGVGPALCLHPGADTPAVEVADRADQLTERCTAVLTWDPDGARLTGPAAEGRPGRVRPFLATPDLAEHVARAMARWTDPGPGGVGLPERVGLAGLVEPATEDGRHSLACPLGLGADGPVPVDLVADGPHALVAGTTGAGKSELLRTWVTGLALRHPPDALAFVLVDYKGGSAFDACARLPHVTGVVTDLDPGLAHRLLVSLRAEVREREARLRRDGAGDLRDLGDGPPRLVVVVDEFATLAADLPDFLGALVDVARRGRSLGLHLVLATQRPAGAVSDDIRANTALRIALRTLDPADSQDVLGGPEAARLPAGRPGRAWIRAGGPPVLVQVATTAGHTIRPAGPPVQVRVAGGPWPHRADDGPTDLTHLVATVAAAWGDRPRPVPTWLPPLPDQLVADGRADGETVLLGRVDQPTLRRQVDLTWSPDDGPLVVLGGRRSGRSTALATAVIGLARARPATDLHVHVVDGGDGLGALAALPQVGAVVAGHDRGSVRRLVGRLGAELADRRQGGDGPLTILVVDGYEALLDGIDDVEGLRLLDALDRLAREGSRHRLALAVTATRPSALAPSLLAAPTLVALGLDDPADHAVLGLPVPTAAPRPGRGQTRAGDEVQLARPGPGDLATVVAAVAASQPACAPGRGPGSVGPLPERVALAPLGRRDGAVVIGLRDRDLRFAAVALRPGDRFVIAGPPRSGRSAALDLLLAAPGLPARTVLRRGDDPGAFLAVVTAWLHAPAPHLFAVDDGELLGDPDEVLRALVARRHPEATVVVTVRSDAWRSAYGTWLAELRPADRGLALAPDPARDLECWTVALPPLGPGRPPPGRGVLLSDDGADVVQVAHAGP